MDCCEKTAEASNEAKLALEPLQNWQELPEEEGEDDGGESERKKAKLSGGGFQTQPLPIWVGAEDGHVPPPPLCGRVPLPLDARIVAGDLVAANVNAAVGKKDSAADLWILCRVDRFGGSKKGHYMVSDVAPDDPSVDSTFDLPRKAIVPLPKMLPRTWDETTEFAPGELVMALFVGTTSFYEATVIESPSNDPDGLYSVKFEDDDDEQGGTPVRFIHFCNCLFLWLKLLLQNRSERSHRL